MKVVPPEIIPIDGLSVFWCNCRCSSSIVLSWPWIVYQLWGFIATGLSQKERRSAIPYVCMFIASGYSRTFWLALRSGIPARHRHERQRATGGVHFLLNLLRVASPRFLLRRSRYAILVMVVIVAIVTPTPDIFYLMLLAIPACLLSSLESARASFW
jgi:sec-independent protein translocase protein TatC